MANPLVTQKRPPLGLSVVEKLEYFTIPEALTGCWLCWAAPGRRGAPMLHDGAKTRRANRIAWEVHRGPIPAGLYVCHRCDNPPCVNPDHLFLGTHADNMADMRAKGRKKGKPVPLRQGERQNTARLTAAQVLEIMRAPGVHREIAARYGVTRGHVSRIKSGVMWKYLPR